MRHFSLIRSLDYFTRRHDACCLLLVLHAMLPLPAAMLIMLFYARLRALPPMSPILPFT